MGRALTVLLRLTSFVLFSILGTSALMFYAPGYFADVREMDATHAASARADLTQHHKLESSFQTLFCSQALHWAHGDLGTSRQYEVPVKGLLRERAWRSARLLLTGVFAGWCAALLLAGLTSLLAFPKLDLLLAAMTSALLAFPVGALATFCLLRDINAPALLLALIVSLRDFKILYRMLQLAWKAPYVQHARAQGLSSGSIFSIHLLPQLRNEVMTLMVVSFTLALSALVPVEVIFDLPGLGQLAWSAAMNRDLPVLVSITAIMAVCVGLGSILVELGRSTGDTTCA